jgi:hypothetical protein
VCPHPENACDVKDIEDSVSNMTLPHLPFPPELYQQFTQGDYVEPVYYKYEQPDFKWFHPATLNQFVDLVVSCYSFLF